ncbi:MAG: HAD-IIB family hydrolase [Nanoarchaeota archaeon]|nr:HAD-IIB family hydrolase [Nanoarchaeota archaeon]
MYKIREGKLIIFDLDGTLTPTKSPIELEMSELFTKLLEKRKVAVVSGADFKQYKKQFIDHLDAESNFNNLFLFPTCSSCFYKYDNEWKKVYELAFSAEEKKRIYDAFEKTFHELNYKHPQKTYGEVIEDRNSQITFSVFGQDAPRELKEKYDPTREKRKAIKEILDKYLTEFEVNVSGTTSIDVTKKGIDKAYAIYQIETALQVTKENMVFIGDAIVPGGNDYPVKRTGIDCIPVKDYKECMELIREVLEKNI